MNIYFPDNLISKPYKNSIPKLIMILMWLVLNTGESIYAQTKYTIVFYNVENLFDISDDPATSDEEFTPQSTRHWTRYRFEIKLKMIYKSLITAGEGQFPDIIGLAEVENRWVVEQLINQTPLSRVSYGIIHKESPDPRGIDVALLYRKDRVKPVDYEFIPVTDYGTNGFKSRDILHFTGMLGNEKLHFFVNHWPSRSGGYVETRERRDIAAGILRLSIDPLLKKDVNSNILIMGDFNASPDEKCFTSTLRALPYPGNGNPMFLINISKLWSNRADGTIRNGGQWEIFDQMICSLNLLTNKTLKILPHQGGICTSGFLLEPDQAYLGKKPYRTYMGPVYHGGISDHLPVKVYISQNQ